MTMDGPGQTGLEGPAAGHGAGRDGEIWGLLVESGHRLVTDAARRGLKRRSNPMLYHYMAGDVQITTTVARVLRVFLDDVGEPRYGFELMRLTGLPREAARLGGGGFAPPGCPQAGVPAPPCDHGAIPGVRGRHSY